MLKLLRMGGSSRNRPLPPTLRNASPLPGGGRQWWRTGLLAVALAMGVVGGAQAQRASDYTFTQSYSAGAYTAIDGTGGTGANAASGGSTFGFYDEESLTLTNTGAVSGTNFNIGTFRFIFNGVEYGNNVAATRLILSANGYVRVGANYQISALPFDLYAPPGNPEGAQLRYELQGPDGDRTLILQWSNFRRYSNASFVNDNLNFQIRINESTKTSGTPNQISIAYGNITTSTATASLPAFSLHKIGINGTAAMDINLRALGTSTGSTATTSAWANSVPGYTSIGTVASASSSTATTASTTVTNYLPLTQSQGPSNGLVYTWTPPATGTRALGTPVATLPLSGLTIGKGSTLNPVLRVQLPVSNSNGTINVTAAAITLTGAASISAGTGVRVYYSHNPEFHSGTSQLLATSTAVNAGTGAVTLGTFTARALSTTNGGSYDNYLYVTADASATATAAMGAAASFTVVGVSAAGGNSTVAATPSVTSPQVVASPGTRAIGYCTPNFASGFLEDIGRVQVGTLNNSSPSATTFFNNTTASNRYTDYTAVAAPSLSQGSAYNAVVDLISSLDASVSMGVSVAVYIDYNQDGLFTGAGETVTTGTITRQSPPITTVRQFTSSNFTVPVTALVGNTRMRVVVSNSTSPCGENVAGEVEDYTVTIAAPQPAQLNGAISAVQWPITAPVGNTSPLVNTSAVTNYSLLRVLIPVTGADGSLTLTSVAVTSKNLVGGVPDDSRVSAVKLFRGTSTTPNTGTVVASGTFSGGVVTLTPGTTETLVSGDNYYYIAYDVLANSATGSVLDASIAAGGIVIGNVAPGISPGSQPASLLDPAGRTVINNICASVATTTLDENIGQVTFNGTSNPSGTVNPATPAAAAEAYTDFTQTTGAAATAVAPFPVLAGGSYSLDITITDISLSCFTGGSGCGMYGGRVDVYVDLNNDNQFTNSEKVAAQGTWTDQPGGRVVSMSVAIPSGTAAGTYRMRIIADEEANSGATTRGALNISASGTAASGCANYAYGETEDYELSVTVPTCTAALSNVLATNITSTQALLSWTSSVTPSNDYDYRIRVGGAATWPALVHVTTNSATPTLLSDTPYEFQVRANCGGLDVGPWVNGNDFRTECAPSAALTEGFEGVTLPNLPACWLKYEVFTGTGFTFPYVRTVTGGATGSTVAQLELFVPTAAATGGRVLAVSPRITNLGAGTNQLRFQAKNSGAGNLIIGRLSDRNDPNSFTALQTVTLTNAYAEYTVSFTGYTGSDRFIGFRHSNDQNTTGGTINVDQIVWETAPTCFPPTALVVSGITQTGATVSFTAPASGTGPGSYVVEYRVGTSGAWSILSPNPAASPATLASLTANTSYEVRIKSDCGGGDESAYSATASFTTLCNPFVADFIETFEGVTTTGSGDSDFTNGPTPSCWTTINVYAAGGTNYAGVNAASGTGGTPSKAWRIYSSTTADVAGFKALVTPMLSDMGGASPASNRLRFSARVDNAAAPTTPNAVPNILVYAIQSPSSTAPRTLIATLTGLTTGYQSFKVDFSTYTGPYQYIALRHSQDQVASGWAIHIDDVNWEAKPTCNDPGALTLGTVTSTTAAFSFGAASPVPALGYQYQYRTGAGAWTGPIDIATGTSATISLLAPSTTYEVQVRSNCSITDQGEWSSSLNFTTNPAGNNVVIVNGNPGTAGLRYPLGFFFGYERSAMVYRASETTRGYVTEVGFYLNTITTQPSITALPVKIYLKQTAANGFAATSTFSTETTGATLVYDGTIAPNTWAAGTYIKMALNTPFFWTADNLEVLVETNFTGGGNGGGTDYAFRYNSPGGTNPMQYWNADTSPPTGTGTTQAGRPNVLLTYGTPPTCFPPQTLAVSNISDVGASLTWSAPSNGTAPGSYNYRYRVVGAPTWIPGSTATASATLSGLTAQTNYEFEVQSNCGGGDLSTFVAGPNFTTDCIAATSFFEDFNSTAVGANSLPGCWRGLVVTSEFSEVGTDAVGVTGNAGYLYASSSSNAAGRVIIVSPRLSNVAAGTHWVRFSAKASSSGQSVIIGVLTDPSNPNTFTAIQTVPLTTSYDEYAVSFAAYAGLAKHIAFRHSQDNVAAINLEIDLDNIYWEPLPNCVAPAAISFVSSTLNSATLTFSAVTPAPGIGYQVQYRVQGSTTWINAPLTSSTTITIGSLAAYTAYEGRVGSQCGPGLSSPTFSPVILFSTVPGDEPCQAIPLSVAIDNTIPVYALHTTLGATTSVITYTGTCSDVNNFRDVWFTVQVPASGSLAVDVQAGAATSLGDAILNLYTAPSCSGTMAIITCGDDEGSGSYPAVSATGLTPGTTVYLRVGGFSNATTQGNFRIAVGEKPLWTGATSTNATVTTNYFPVFDPIAGLATQTITVVPAASNAMNLNGTSTLTLGGLTVPGGASVTLNATSVLTVNGTSTLGGTLTQADGATLATGTPAGAIISLPAFGQRQLKNLRIGTGGASITGTYGSDLTITRVLEVRGTLTVPAGQLLTLLSNASGTAMVYNNGGAITGTVNAQRYVDPSTNSTLGYRHFASPMTNAPFSQLGSWTYGPTFPAVYKYTETSVVTQFDEGWSQAAGSPATTMTGGEGYAVLSAGAYSPIFVGQVNNGANVTRTVSNTTGVAGTGTYIGSGNTNNGSGWNFLGNNYPSPLDVDAFMNSFPANVFKQVSVWRPLPSALGAAASGQYVTRIPGTGTVDAGVGAASTRWLPMGGAFFVKVPAVGSASVTMTNAMRPTSYQNTQHYRQAPDTRLVVTMGLTAQDGLQVTDKAYVTFDENATVGVDNGLDGYKLLNIGDVPSLASVAGADMLAINSLPALTSRTVVPLAVSANNAGSYKLNADELLNLPVGLRVYLLDAVTGTRQDLMLNGTYVFTMDPGTTSQRFSLVFEPAASPLGVTNTLAGQVDVYPNPVSKAQNVSIRMTALQTTARTVTATLYNALGQSVAVKALPVMGGTLEGSLNTTSLSAGVYTLKLTADGQTAIRRVVIE